LRQLIGQPARRRALPADWRNRALHWIKWE
jgi:hypothetical protein